MQSTMRDARRTSDRPDPRDAKGLDRDARRPFAASVLALGVTAATFLCAAALLAGVAAAQNPVDDALAWLAGDRNASGSWGAAFEFVDTCTVVETLAIAEPGGTPLEDGVDWLVAESAANHQESGRKIAALAKVPSAALVAEALAGSLLAAKNPVEPNMALPNWPEGGWGLAPGFGTDCQSTALALLGLEAAGLVGGISVADEPLPAGASNVHEWTIPSDATVARILITVVGATVRLRMTEGAPPTGAEPFFTLPPGTFLIVFPDSGLPFTAGQNFIELENVGAASSYSFTASYETPDLDTRSFDEALDYLRESQNVDGGFPTQRGGATDFYTTLHVILAMQAFGGYDLDDERAAALAFLTGEQLAGGGFGFSGTPISYVTALGGLALVRSETYPFGAATNDAIAALLAMQDAGGSWDFEAYHTALSILAAWEHNQPPTADAGPDQEVDDSDNDGFETVTLSGSGGDVDGTIQSYAWTEDGVLLATGANPMVSLAVGSHDILLTVTDDGGRKATDTVTVIVNGACDPVTGLSCSSAGADVVLSWTNAAPYVFINVYRDGVLIRTITDQSETYTDQDLATATYTYTVEAICEGPFVAPGVDCVHEHVRPCGGVTDVACASNGADVDLTWTNGDAYDAVNVYREGVLVAILPGAAEAYTDLDVPTGMFTYMVEGECPAGVLAPGTDCMVDHVNPCEAVLDLTCRSELLRPVVDWTAGDVYDEIRVYRDGGLVATLPGSFTLFRDLPLLPGVYTYTVEPVCPDGGVAPGSDRVLFHTFVCPPGLEGIQGPPPAACPLPR